MTSPTEDSTAMTSHDESTPATAATSSATSTQAPSPRVTSPLKATPLRVTSRRAATPLQKERLQSCLLLVNKMMTSTKRLCTDYAMEMFQYVATSVGLGVHVPGAEFSYSQWRAQSDISRLETAWSALGHLSRELSELRMRGDEGGVEGGKILAGTATGSGGARAGSSLERALRVLSKDLADLRERLRVQLSSLGAEPQTGGSSPFPGPAHTPPHSSRGLQGFLVLSELGAWLQRLGRDLVRLRLLAA
ncbi:unnamed protein product [Lampetra fluviatilis]